MLTDNHGVHTERGLRPDLKWTTLLSPPGDAGHYLAKKNRREMIERAQMLPAIIAACPDFATTYDAFVTEWKDEPETPHYLALADFSRHVISLLETGNRQQLHVAFETIERLNMDGDEYVREAATIGILESLQNTNLHSRTHPDQFIEFLRPVSLRYWRKVEDFWEDGTIITDD